MVPDANENKEGKIPVIDIGVLRGIRRIVETLRNRIDSGDENGTGDGAQPFPTGDRSGSKVNSSDCSKDINQQKEENR